MLATGFRLLLLSPPHLAFTVRRGVRLTENPYLPVPNAHCLLSMVSSSRLVIPTSLILFVLLVLAIIPLPVRAALGDTNCYFKNILLDWSIFTDSRCRYITDPRPAPTPPAIQRITVAPSPAPARAQLTTQAKTVSDMKKEEARMVCAQNPYQGCEDDWLRYGNIYPAPNPAISEDVAFYSSEELDKIRQDDFDACNSAIYPDACKAEVRDRYGMSYTPTDPDASPDNWDRWGAKPSILAPAPVRATEFVDGGIYDDGFLVGMRTGDTADYAPTFKTGWFGGWWDRVVLQIPDTTPSAQQAPARVEERQATTPRPLTRDEESALGRVTITAEETLFTPSGPVRSAQENGVQEPGLVRRFTDFWGFTSPEPPAPMYDPKKVYPENKYYGATIDANIDSNKDDVLNVEEYVNEYYRQNPPAEAVPDYGGVPIGTADTGDVFIEQAPDYQMIIQPEDYGDGGYLGDMFPELYLYNVPTRQFSQAEPSANPFYNQSLAASVFNAFLGQ